MAKVADYVLNRLTEWGIHRIYGYSGDGSTGFLGALDRAKLLGLKGIKVDDPKQMGAAWDEALAADRPVVLEVVVDPEIPPIPPHIKKQKLHEFTESVKEKLPGGEH